MIGGLLTAVLEDTRDRGRERREALAAVRILETDLIYIAAALDPVLLGKPWFAPPHGFPLSEWEAQRAAIARWRRLDTDEWTALSQAFDLATQLERHLPELADDGEILSPTQLGLSKVASTRAKLGLGACRYIQRRLIDRGGCDGSEDIPPTTNSQHRRSIETLDRRTRNPDGILAHQSRAGTVVGAGLSGVIGW